MELLRVIPAVECSKLDRDRSSRFKFRVPIHWRSPVQRNPYALEAQRETLAWFASLGCTDAELARASKFDIAGYVGIPFPFLSREATVRLAKYLSMWLLWDDLQIENLENRWRLDAAHVLGNRMPDGMTRFDHGWWALFEAYAAQRSAAWIEGVCRGMHTWNDAALDEAAAMKAMRDDGQLPAFEDQLEMRIATIGMYVTVSLLEDTYGVELPRELHDDPGVLRLKKLANKLVGLGNDVFSFAKDHREGHLNLVSSLIHRGATCDVALEQVIRMHDNALDEFDGVAMSLPSFGSEIDAFVERWLQDVRYASLGFTLWESRAPRYNAHKVVYRARVLEPAFSYITECSQTELRSAHGA